MRFEFHPEALAEYEEAGHHYRRQQSGLDLRFIVCVEEVIEQILPDPYRWRVFDEDIRRSLTKVFPYAVLYNRVRLRADCRRGALQPRARLLEAPSCRIALTGWWRATLVHLQTGRRIRD